MFCLYIFTLQVFASIMHHKQFSGPWSLCWSSQFEAYFSAKLCVIYTLHLFYYLRLMELEDVLHLVIPRIWWTPHTETIWPFFRRIHLATKKIFQLFLFMIWKFMIIFMVSHRVNNMYLNVPSYKKNHVVSWSSHCYLGSIPNDSVSWEQRIFHDKQKYFFQPVNKQMLRCRSDYFSTVDSDSFFNQLFSLILHFQKLNHSSCKILYRTV